MKIAIDARFYGITGIGRYLSNLITNLENITGDSSVEVLLRKENFDVYRPQNTQYSKVLLDIPWYSFKEQLMVPLYLYRKRYDLVHFPHLNVPVFYFRPYVVTIHDLIMHTATKGATTRMPLYFTIKKQIYKFVVSWAARRAKKIIVPTNKVKEELIAVLRLPPEKIIVTYEAVDDVFFVKASEIKNDAHFVKNVSDRFKITPPYFVYLSSFYEHKNHRMLIDAFKILHDEGFVINDKQPQLILIGKQDRFAERIYDYITEIGMRQHIILPGRSVEGGYVSDEDAIAILSQAELFICPSKKEGFGINFLEAMALEVPVVLSNASCIPEVGGDAALYFDPESKQELVNAVKEVLNDAELKQHLIEKGAKRVKLFSWQKMAEQTFEVYELALK